MTKSKEPGMPSRIEQRLVLVGVTIAVAVFWMIGDMLEFEFPHSLTIYRAAHARTATGEPAAEVIAQKLQVPRSALDWHRCSFCKNFDRELPARMRRVQVSVALNDNYVFAFDSRRSILYPGDARTQTRFSSMPAAWKQARVQAF